MGKLLCKTALQKSNRGSLCLTTIDVTSKDTYKYDGGMTRCLSYFHKKGSSMVRHIKYSNVSITLHKHTHDMQ
ncbi:hypothetical protein L2E82_23188 [Cichorium intybus]|uniref:Uncharacterized protein n=1 Tax=Cichorium intybus TaxID=13427 RepID=A0ACB9DZY3_CICIN|nr:hypothetical protein L2E82_23188 [Cichorium intybus]